ncbi:MAG: hypothetical protein ACP5GF_08935 [Thiomonas sp.]
MFLDNAAAGGLLLFQNCLGRARLDCAGRHPHNHREIAMKGDERALQFLHKALKVELSATDPYVLHVRRHQNEGLGALAGARQS